MRITFDTKDRSITIDTDIITDKELDALSTLGITRSLVDGITSSDPMERVKKLEVRISSLEKR